MPRLKNNTTFSSYGGLMHYVWHRSEQKNAALRLPPRSAAPRRAPETRFILFMFLAASAPASWRSGLWFVCLPPGGSGGRRGVGFTVGSRFFFPRRLHSAPPKLPISGRDVTQRGGAGPMKQVRSRLSKSQSDFSRLSKTPIRPGSGFFFNRRCHLMMTSSFKAAVKLNDDEPDSASTD